jgi:hypothetical protein
MKYIILIASVLTIVFQVTSCTRGVAAYQEDYEYHWNLADKSSTIDAKKRHVENFYNALEMGYARGEFASYNAIIFQNPNNKFTENLKALKTLKDRLDEVDQMDPKTFEYNTAIQQITQQEQGEASEMLSNFSQSYMLSEHPISWDWISGVIGIGAILIGIGALTVIANE